MTTRTRLNAELATRRYTRRHAREIVTAVLGNNSGTVVATTDTRWYWIRLHADPNQVVRAWNTGFVPPVPNLPVDVEIVKANGITDYQIIGVSLNRGVVADVNAGATGSHALQHQRRDFNTGGFDPLDIYGRAIVQLRARAQATPDMTLYVEPGWYSVAGIATYFAGGNSPAFTAPASGFRCDLLYLDNTGTLQIVTGTAVPFGTPARPAQPSADDLPLAYIYLTAATTSVTEYLIEDGRMVFGGAGGGVGAHNILSATHSDTTVVAPGDDDVVTWDAVSGTWSAEPLPGVDIATDAANITAVNFTEQGADVAAPGAGHTILYLMASGVAKLRNAAATIYTLMVNVMTALGDTIYGGASGAVTRLAGNTTTTRKFLRQTGTGAASAAPAWDTLQAGDIPDLSATYALVGAGGGGHLHGLDRWVADGGATFNLLDFAEYVDAVFDNGSAVDPITITLSADLSQIVFDSAPTAGHILTAEYVVAGA